MKILSKKILYFFAILFIAFLSFPFFNVKAETSSTNYIIDQDTENATGHESTSTNYVINGDVGDSAVGESLSSNYKVYHGSWGYFDSTGTSTTPSPTPSPEPEQDEQDLGSVPLVLSNNITSDTDSDDTGDDSSQDSEGEDDDGLEGEDGQTEDGSDNNPDAGDDDTSQGSETADNGDEQSNEQTEEVDDEDNFENEKNQETEGETGDDTTEDSDNEKDQSFGDNTSDQSATGDASSHSIGSRGILGGIGKVFSDAFRGIKNTADKVVGSILGKSDEGSADGLDFDYLTIKQNFQDITEYTKDIVQTEAAETTNKVALGSASALSVLVIASQMDSFTQVPYALFNLFGIFAYRKRRKRREGRVYDAKTGQPVSFARVTIYDEKGKAKETKISDKYGTYFFLVPEGRYILDVQKKDYRLPTEEDHQNIDIIYSSGYSKNKILNFDKDGMVVSSIPLLPQEKRKAFLDIFSRSSVYFLLNLLFYFGFAVSFLTLVWEQNFYNYLVLFIYLLLYLLRLVNVAKPNWGVVYSDQGITQAFSFVNVFEKGDEDKFVARTVTDEKGRYAFILDRGSYKFDVITTDQKKASTNVFVKARKIIAKNIKI